MKVMMSTNDFHLPQPEQLKSVLGMLFGNSTEAQDADILDPSDSDVFTATYVDDSNQLVATCSCDVAFAAYAGASLSMLPVGGAREMVETNDLFPMVFDNLNEIMNIVSTTFMCDHSAHLRLGKLYKPTELSETVGESVAGSLYKRGVSVEVPGYGAGNITLVTF